MTGSASTNSPDFQPTTSGVGVAASPDPEEVSLTGDYDEAAVPLSKRRSKTVMFLIFVTLQIAMSTIYTGFLARSEGLSFGQLLILQRHLGGCIAAAAVVAEPGLVLASSPPA
jgi:hypothetical protein